MDWDKKFSSIVAETEANLAKAKQKLKAPSPYHWSTRWTSEKYLTGNQLPNSLLGWSVSTPSSLRGIGEMHPLGSELASSRDSLAVHPASPIPHYHSVMEEQKKTIGGLNKLVHDLEEERRLYQRQIDDLKREMGQISSHLLEQQRGTRVERQLERLQRDVSQEVQGLRSTLESSLLHSQLSNPNLSFQDLMNVKEGVHDEMTSIKRELSSLRNRLENVEHSMFQLSTTQRDRPYSNFRDNRLNRSMYEGSTRPLRSLLSPHSLPSRCAPLSPSLSPSFLQPSLERLQLDHIRGTVTSMKTKLEELDSRLSAAQRLQPTANGFAQHHWQSGKMTPPLDLDDLSLTDVEDEFEDDLESAFTKEKFTTRHYTQEGVDDNEDDDNIDADDLDLDDLDLSDDDDDDADNNDDGIRNIYASGYFDNEDIEDGDIKDGGDGDDDLSLDSADLADIDDL